MHSTAEADVDDPTSLRRTAGRFDTRYVRCERPTVITGGELTLDMLDLVYNKTARIYQAPLQLKFTGGIFIVDDLGRQIDPPQTLVNCWIVKLEENKDILAMQSSEKFEVPFDTLVFFSTNFPPNKIFDKAALRRIFYKIKIDGPSQADFLKIIAMVARKKKMPLDEATLVHLLNNRYPEIDNVYANYQPVFLIDQMIAICEFEGIPYQMTPELIDRAWANMFVQNEDIVRWARHLAPVLNYPQTWHSGLGVLHVYDRRNRRVRADGCAHVGRLAPRKYRRKRVRRDRWAR